MIGHTISHYKILEKLGEGGMGVVYKAQDLKLDRPVALKFLPARLSTSEPEKARLIQEARAASALNHPNVATIHEIAEADDQTFLVMEYVDGVTLREKAQEGRLKIKEIVGIAIQAAEGLQKAHEQQIIHRDIKSDNIMLTKDGLVKVMDFGLAKLKGAAKVTKTGSTVGTAAYMSPEQIQGEEIDYRTDIFSFGVVLYEILAGQLPFRGEHEAALIYEIVNVQPPSLLDLQKNVDSELNRIVTKCLEKDRDERYQSMREVVVDLKRYKRDSEGKRIERPLLAGLERKPFPLKIKRSSLILGALVVLALAIGAWIYFRPQVTEAPRVPEAKLTKVTFDPGLEDEPTWSPDGKFLAYTTDERGNLDIVVLPLGGGQPIRVVESDADDAQPSWSPDGSKLAFVSARDHTGRLSIVLGQGVVQSYVNGKGGDIFLVPALGGTPVKLVRNGYYPAWSPDGKTIVFQSNRGGNWDIWVVPAEGGKPTQLTIDEAFDYHPSFSLDGRWILYASGDGLAYDLRAIPAGGGEPTNITNDRSPVVKPGWTPDGKHILFSSARSGVMNIWKVPFSPSGDRKSASPTRVTIGEGNDVNLSATANGNTIAFATVRNTADIWELTLSTGKLRQVTSETSSEDHPHVSPDGRTLLVQSNRGEKPGIWTMDLNGKVLSQLAYGDNPEFQARWSPDGKEIAYSQDAKIVTQKLGDVSAREVAPEGFTPSWSPAGKKLAFSRISDGKTDIWIHWLETGETKQITFLESDNGWPTWSPDGNSITFTAQKGSKRDIFVVASNGGTPRRITSGEAEFSHPRWSPRDKDEILCLRDHKNVCLVSVSTGKVKQITDFVEANVILDHPSWSFDGKKIYFSLAKKVGDVYILENY
ncbi:MAG: protein kinase [Bacteroidota bacterium]